MAPDLTVDPLAVAEITHHGSAATLVVHDCSNPVEALAALDLAMADLWAIPHPDEPASGLPNFVRVASGTDGPELYLDVKDEGPLYADRILAVVADRLREAGVVGTLGPPDSHLDELYDAVDEALGDRPTPDAVESPRRPVTSLLPEFPRDFPAVEDPGSSAQVHHTVGADGRTWTQVQWTRLSTLRRPDDLTDPLRDAGWSLTRRPIDDFMPDTTPGTALSFLRHADGEAWQANRGEDVLYVVSWLVRTRNSTVVIASVPKP